MSKNKCLRKTTRYELKKLMHENRNKKIDVSF